MFGTIRALAFAGAATMLAGGTPSPAAADPDPARWPAVVEEARGDDVYFHAWGGSENVNAYIAWVAGEVDSRFGIRLHHVKLADTADAVATIVAEKAAGRTSGGSVDLVWINGENFAALKGQGLLHAPGFATHLPNWRHVDLENPGATADFTVPTDGQESPWGRAKLVFFTDTARDGDLAAMPRSTDELLVWAKANPGRFTYPAPPDFTGSSFLKQVLIERTPSPEALARPVDEARFQAVTAPLWAWLDEVRPVLWRQGRDHPRSYPQMRQMLADGELGIVFAFNPAEASAAIAAGELPDTVRSFVLSGGTIGNTHYVAIPFNANAKAAAMVVADFLLSPEAQLRKEDPAVWGDPTVLSMERLDEADRRAFAAVDRGVATLPPAALGRVLAEPHPSWMSRIETEWQTRYGS